MGLKRILSQKYDDPDLGRVHLRTLSTAVRFSARWKPDGLHVTVPARTSVAEYTRVMEGWKPRLMAIRPAERSALYSDGFSFDAGDWSFVIRAIPGWRRHYVGWERTEGDRYVIKVSPDDNLSTPSMERAVSKALMHVASRLAAGTLIRQAEAEAARLGLTARVRSWSVGRGLRRLGCCKASGAISLSAVLMFFPKEARRSTITHELAHLTHFDHSPAFYALWEKYLGHSHRIHRPDPDAAPVI